MMKSQKRRLPPARPTEFLTVIFLVESVLVLSPEPGVVYVSMMPSQVMAVSRLVPTSARTV